MVYVIMSSDVDRNQAGRSWMTKAIIFSTSCALAGLGMGGLLGTAGTLMPLDARIAVAAVLAVLAVGLGALDVTRRSVPVLQRNRETSQLWMHSGALRGAARNGFALGMGFSTRIGFWLWYAVPAGALLAGDWRVGLALYGTYGVARGLAPWGIVLAGEVSRHTGQGDVDVGWWLAQRAGLARAVASGQLLFLGLIIGIGLG